MDFTITKYKQLLNCLIENDYQFQTFKEFMTAPMERVVILRHDVDDLPKNSLRFARIQHDLGIKGVFYFRSVPKSWDEDVIKEIESLGHEIGYHYETMETSNGDIHLGWELFQENLKNLRELTEVSTVCMHGSPKSKFDNRSLWDTYDYKSLGLIGEPYYDIDFKKVLYCTDTGRRWDGNKVSVRDKVNSGFSFKLHSTNDIMDHIKENKLPNQIMFTFHPQRWHDNTFLWVIELLVQSFKNVIKRFFYVKSNHNY